MQKQTMLKHKEIIKKYIFSTKLYFMLLTYVTWVKFTVGGSFPSSSFSSHSNSEIIHINY